MEPAKLCFCGCGKEAVGEVCYTDFCSRVMAEKCQTGGFCNECAYFHGCPDCNAYIKRIGIEVEQFTAIRRERMLTDEERARVQQLHLEVIDDWDRAVLFCLLEFK